VVAVVVRKTVERVAKAAKEVVEQVPQVVLITMLLELIQIKHNLAERIVVAAVVERRMVVMEVLAQVEVA
jgi:hypothetical protein